MSKPIPNPGEMLALEAIIDRCGLYETIAAIRIITSDKADHIRANWQDNQTAATWDRAGKAIERAALHGVVAEVSR